jgi:CRP-like cAMP-binding protein
MTDALHRLKETLQQPSHARSEADLLLIQNFTRNIDFFKELNEEQGNEVLHRACCKVMQIKSYSSGQTIFRYGDPGDFFCIILKGCVTLFAPQKVMKNSDLAEGVVDTQPAADEDKEHDNTDDQEAVGEPHIKLRELQAGQSFGELSILSKLSRSATAESATETYIGIIRAKDFSSLLASYEDNKLNTKAEFLGNLAFLKSWTKVALYKLTYFFSERTYKLNQVVYKEGSPADEVYIIRSGEFKVTSTQFSKVVSQTSPINLKSLTSGSPASAIRTLKECSQPREEKLWMVIKGQNEMFGDTDVIEDSARKQTCICSTRRAEVYVIRREVRLT